MKQPDEVPSISVQEHLKITVSERISTGNVETEKIMTKVVMSQRVK